MDSKCLINFFNALYLLYLNYFIINMYAYEYKYEYELIFHMLFKFITKIMTFEIILYYFYFSIKAKLNIRLE